MIARSFCLFIALVFASTAASAQDLPPSPPAAPVSTPTPPPAPVGFSGRAHITLSFPIRNSVMTAAARLAVAQRDQLTRVDLLSVDMSMLPMQIPALTFVIDRGTNTITSWNDAAHVYFTQSFLPRGFGGPARVRVPRPERSMLADLDLLTFDVRLTGHGTVAGIAATGLAFDAKARRHGKTAVTHVNGTVEIADDFAFFPLASQSQIFGNGRSTPARASYIVDAFVRQAPPPESFVVPSGYRQAAGLLGVFSGIPRPRPSSVPAPLETASGMPTTSP